MFSNDYVSELIWNRTRACCTPSRRYTRCRRCSCWSGPCELCKLFNFNFNHVTEAEAASTWRHMLSWSYHLSLQFKTGLRLRLTSSVKELEQIIKLMNLNKFWSKMRQNDWLASMAMRMPSDLGSSGLGSVQQRKRNRFSQELEKWEKKAV
jgi:hypothetical protein